MRWSWVILANGAFGFGHIRAPGSAHVGVDLARKEASAHGQIVNVADLLVCVFLVRSMFLCWREVHASRGTGRGEVSSALDLGPKESSTD